MVPLIINPIYTLYNGYLLGISPSIGLLGGLKQLGYHPRVPAFSLWHSFVGFWELQEAHLRKSTGGIVNRPTVGIDPAVKSQRSIDPTGISQNAENWCVHPTKKYYTTPTWEKCWDLYYIYIHIYIYMMCFGFLCVFFCCWGNLSKTFWVWNRSGH